MWWQVPFDAYHSVIQPSLTVTVTVEYETEIVSHNNNKHTNLARNFPRDFADFQKISRISRKKNNSSRFPRFQAVLDTLTVFIYHHQNSRQHYAD